MLTEDGVGQTGSLWIAKVDGLRQLHDAVVREFLSHLFAQALMTQPQIPKISTPVKQDDPARR